MPNPQIRVSVSQIKTYKRCQKKWWYEKGPLKLQSPPTKSTILGSAVHKVLEDYLEHGTAPPENKAGRVASCGLDKLRPGDTLDIERSITLPLSENSTILCRIDMTGKDPEKAYIGDHKTTSDFSWAKTQDEIKSDVQLLTYARAAYHENQPKTVDIELIYYRTRGLPVSMALSDSVSWDDIEANWAALGEIAENMAPKKDHPTGETSEPNAEACGDYGGCPHAVICPFSPKNREKEPATLAQLVKGEYKGDGKTKKGTPPAKPKAEKMKKRTASIQAAFGILPPDAPAQEQTTNALFRGVAAKLADLLDLFEGPIPNARARAFFVKEGIAVDDIPKVLDILGATLTPQGEIMQATPTTPTTPTTPPPAAPPDLFRAKRCTVEDQRRVGAALAKNTPREGVSETEAQEWATKEIYPSSLTGKRWSRIVEFSGLTLDGSWLMETNREGYTVDPEEPTGAEADRAAYTAKTGKPAPVAPVAPAPAVPVAAVEFRYPFYSDTSAGAAIAAPLVVLVDARFAIAIVDAITLDDWLAPHIEKVEKMQKKPLYLLDVDYGKGDKFLAGVLTTAAPSTGLIMATSTHPRIGVALSALSNQGAVIIYGR